MTRGRFLRIVVSLIGLVATLLIPLETIAQEAAGVTLDEAAAPADNYDKAEFRFWYPIDAGFLMGVIVLVPGLNSDGRPAVADSVWQAFATRHQLALVGCHFTDKPHDQDFIEEYANAAHGSGQALVDALIAFAARSRHHELTGAPLFLWGMSAGGEFNYEFVAWKPERVAAFVANKGGIYYSALVRRAARDVPGILFVGGQDLESRTKTIVGLFTLNRRAGALWALAEEPGVAHIVGRSRDMALIFFEDVLDLRLTKPSPNVSEPTSLKPLSENTGFLGDLKAKTIQVIGDALVPKYSTAWLPTLRVARAWQALVTEKPFDPDLR